MKYERGELTVEKGEVGRVELFYPSDEVPAFVDIELSHVRASDGIRIRYDFERDGWVIMQPSTMEYPETWVESAFVESWAKSPDEENGA
jgi:hypothetical protein